MIKVSTGVEKIPAGWEVTINKQVRYWSYQERVRERSI